MIEGRRRNNNRRRKKRINNSSSSNSNRRGRRRKKISEREREREKFTLNTYEFFKDERQCNELFLKILEESLSEVLIVVKNTYTTNDDSDANKPDDVDE